MRYEQFIVIVVLLIYLALLVLGIVSLILAKKSQGFRKKAYIAGGTIMLILFLGMTYVFVDRILFTKLY